MYLIKIAIFIMVVAELVKNVDLAAVEEDSNPKQEQVVVRAVFINCEPDEEQNYVENDASHFQREELYKHSALQGCHKKLALTVKMISEPDQNCGDEYIPIEHVFDGSNKRRARLLDPYILRIRRDPPVQAYKLRRIDTVSGIVTKSSEEGTINLKKNRVQRNLDNLTEQKVRRQPIINANRHNTTDSEVEEKQDSNQCNIPENIFNISRQHSSLMPKTRTVVNMPSIEEHMNEGHSKNLIDLGTYEHTRVKRDGCTLTNNPAWKRDKRHEHNIIIEDLTDDYKIPWEAKDRFYRRLEQPRDIAGDLIKNKKSSSHKTEDEMFLKPSQKSEPHHRASHLMQNEHHQASSKREKTEEQINPIISSTTKLKSKSYNYVDHTTYRSVENKKVPKVKNPYKKSLFNSPEKKFVMYDIGEPDLWYNIHVQLFEKGSTFDGKTMWNDITKGEVASVSSVRPEYTDQDINVRYKPTQWIPKDAFTLPASPDLCLLVPVFDESSADTSDDLNTVGKYIVVHKDDIVDIEPNNMMSKRDRNYTDFASIVETNNLNEQSHRRRVLVRVSRALLTGNENNVKVSTLGSDHFLTLPHRRSHHAQIDLEARADENQLIRVGSSGSIITVVADNSRRTRSVITIQATNKGLAAAQFRVKARDCGPEIASLLNEKEEELMDGPAMVPPRHTQRFRLELPTELPVDTVHCSVALINDDDESVAVRDVAIKKGDRCFCVWHCDCVCLNEDPKLLCREMAESRQVAAGLSSREKPRRARSVCYPDETTVNLFVVIVGVLMALLMLGLVKACMGLFCRCIGKWGIDKLVQMPRKLNHYYEAGLCGRRVIYDDEGWPVHPDTKKRNVRQIPRQTEFMLNIILFITVPWMLLYDAMIHGLCRSSRRQQCSTIPDSGVNQKSYSTHDMQGLQQLLWRGRRGNQQRWMTPQAQDLSKDIWCKGLATRKSIECEFMRPLLHERHHTAGEPASSCVDSELDDTEYVLTQMQKSKESLARSQKKLNESGTSSATARRQSHT